MTTFTPRKIRFGVFEADLRTGELRKEGLKAKLQGQPFQVLAALLERAGDLVTRDELRQRLWGDHVHVDFEHSLNKAVTKLRTVLGDTVESPRYVETLERRGYRFVAPVEVVDEPASPNGGTNGLRVMLADFCLPLREGPNLIGREPSANVFIDSPAVSRRHAVITVQNHVATIRDLGSKNGTFLNGEPVVASATLNDGDKLVVATTVLLFRSGDALPALAETVSTVRPMLPKRS